MQYWIMKSEPDAYSIDDLKRDRVGQWDGIRNYQVRNMLRDDMKVGDRALFYHSSCAVPAIVGEMEIAEAAYPDPTQFDSKSQYFDPKSPKNAPRWLAVKVRFIEKYANAVMLADMKDDSKLAGMRLLQRGNRLSVMPITKAHYTYLMKRGTNT